MPELLLDWQINTRYGKRALEALGLIPTFVLADDPRPAHEQFDERYIFGGWNPMLPGKWQLDQNDYLHYPGDPPMEPIAFAMHGTERIIVYPHAFVCIVYDDGKFSVARMD